MVDKTIALILKYRSAIIITLFIVTGFCVFQTVQKLRVDNSLSIWFLEDNPNYKAYIDFQEAFGSDEIFILMLPVNNAIGALEKSNLLKLHNAIDSLSFVKTSFSLAKAKYPIYANDKINFDDLYNVDRSEKGLKSLLSKLPNITSQLLTKDYKNQFFYIQLNPTPSIEEQRQTIGIEIRQIIEKQYSNYYLTGPPVLNEAYSTGVFNESLSFGILTILVITIMLLFLLPNRRYLLVSLLSVAIPLAILFGIITALGFSLNMISMLIPTILMVYSVSDAVHIINIYHKEGLVNKTYTKTTLIILAIKKSIMPCFYTTLTTFVGYFALYLSPLPAFKNMGVFTCVGLVLSFLLVYVITIIGFSFMSLNFKNTKPLIVLESMSQKVFIRWVNGFTTRYKTSIIAVFTLVLLSGIYAVSFIKIDTNSLDLLAEGKAKQDLRIIEQAISASSRLQLSISTLKEATILNTEALKYLENFQEKLQNNPLVASPVSVVNIKSFLQKRTPVLFQNQVSKEKVESTLTAIDIKDNSFFKLFSDDFKTAGMTIGLKEANRVRLEKTLFEVKQAFEEKFPTEDYKLKINGFGVVYAQLNNFILETQFKSFFIAFFVAFLCLWFFIKSLRTTVLVLIPNMLPLAVLALFMVLFDIPLNVTTAMITPIMLGIAMDDTIHLVYKYRKNINVKETPESRINNAMAYTGGALLSTTIALVAGFLIISSSAVPSVREFGLLCAVTVAVALITDVFYLPALLKKFDD